MLAEEKIYFKHKIKITKMSLKIKCQKFLIKFLKTLKMIKKAIKTCHASKLPNSKLIQNRRSPNK